MKDDARLIAAVKQIAVQASKLAPEIERERLLPSSLLSEMKSAGVFRMFVPRQFGGLECDLPTIVEVIRIISRGDASTGWAAMIGAGGPLLATMLPRATFARIYGDATDVILAGSTQLGGTITAHGEDWWVTGRWPFASGSEWADWLLGFCTITPRADQSESSGVRVVILPADRWAITDTWRAAGLRGTSSNDISVDGAVLDGVDFFDLSGSQRWADGPLYAGVPQMIALLHGAVSLGIAEGAVEDLLAVVQGGRKQERSALPIKDSELFHRDFGEIHAKVRAAVALLSSQTHTHWEHARVDALCNDVRLMEGTQAAIWVIQTCRSVVMRCFELAGSVAIYDTSPIQRRLRDILVAAQHNLIQPRNYQKRGKSLAAGEEVLKFEPV